MPKLIIAIDGPAGSGKTTVARLLAERLGLGLLDTGAMYRATAFALRLNPALPPGQVAREAEISFQDGKVMLGDRDVTNEIRNPLIDHVASTISTDPEVRDALVSRQRKIIAKGGWVLEGRDTTTVIAPDATLRIFLTASVDVRARRRWNERKKKTTLKGFIKEIERRDGRDYSRAHSPLRLVSGVHKIDSAEISAEEVVERILQLLEK